MREVASGLPRGPPPSHDDVARLESLLSSLVLKGDITEGEEREMRSNGDGLALMRHMMSQAEDTFKTERGGARSMLVAGLRRRSKPTLPPGPPRGAPASPEEEAALERILSGLAKGDAEGGELLTRI